LGVDESAARNAFSVRLDAVCLSYFSESLGDPMSKDSQIDEILTERFWKRPDPAQKGDDNRHDTYQAIGYACSQWEHLEDSLAQIFLTITSTPGPYRRGIRRAYGSIFGGTGRRKAIQSAAEAYFGSYWSYSAVRDTMVCRLNAVGWASKLRDDVVHGAVTGISIVRDDGSLAILGSFLMPPDYNTDRTTTNAQRDEIVAFTTARYRYVAAQINEFASSFGRLRFNIESYKQHLIMQPDGCIPLIRDLIEGGVIPEKKP
jgi:hypothetical protein